MKSSLLSSFVLLILATVFIAASCKPQDSQEPAQSAALEMLAKRFEKGEISKCDHEGKLVYVCALNANDAGSEIYNAEGEKIATCNAAWGAQPDAMCSEVNECEVIYRVADNIWGKPAVDKLSE